jgi:ADP-ribosylglycohydrolase
MKAETKYIGSIKLAAIGDALGWITEFENSQKRLQEKYNTDKIDRFYDWEKKVGGRFYGYIDRIRAGSYSDDTQLLLAVARSIKKDGGVDNEYFSKKELAGWLDYARGGGRTVKTAANKISRKSAQWYNNFFKIKDGNNIIDYRDSGANGVAMRILPIALANLGDFETIKREIFYNGIITHGHPNALIGAMLYGYAVDQIIVAQPDYFNPESFLIGIGKDFPTKFAKNFFDRYETQIWLKEWNKDKEVSFEKVYEDSIIDTHNKLRYIYKSLRDCLSLKETLSTLGCYSPATKSSGTGTVVAALYFTTKFWNDPVHAIIESVNSIGTDTDSIAAIVGGLLGALHGNSVIPERWKKIQDEQYLEEIAKSLLSISEDTYLEEPNILSNAKFFVDLPPNHRVNVGDQITFLPLGFGHVTSIEEQPTLTKGKYNRILEVSMSSGQTIKIVKLFSY